MTLVTETPQPLYLEISIDLPWSQFKVYSESTVGGNGFIYSIKGLHDPQSSKSYINRHYRQ